MASRSSKGPFVRDRGLAGTERPQSTPSKIFSAVAAFFAVIAVVGTFAAAQTPDRARTEALARRATERLQALQREADRLASEERTLLGELRKLEIERQLRAEELKRLDADAAKVEAELTATDRAGAGAADARSARREPELRARLVEIYKLGRARYLRLILSTPDLKQLGQATRTVAALAKLDRDRIASHQQTLSELTRTRQALEQRRAELAALRTAAAKAQAAAQRAAQARAELVRDIDQKRDLNAQLAGELQTTQQKLQAVLRDMATGVAARAVETAALPLRPFRGDLPWPVNGQAQPAVQPAERRRTESTSPRRKARRRARHSRRRRCICGHFCRIRQPRHPGSRIADLQPLRRSARNQRSRRGRVSSTANPSATSGRRRRDRTALYFELRVDGQPVDPLQWLKKR